MRRTGILWGVVGALAVAVGFARGPIVVAGPAPAPEYARMVTSFDSEWRFRRADAPGAEQSGFDDHTWRRVDLPHDWSIEGPFAADNPTRGSGGFLPAGVGWYRKHFTLPSGYAGRRVSVEFDGVMANSEVWINGRSLGKRPSGYVSFRYDLTPYLSFGPGKENVLAVRADNAAQPASRWYAGAGIYRHVRLVVTDPVYLEPWATVVTTPQVTADRVTVQARSTVVNTSDAPHPVALQVTLLGPDGATVVSVETPPQTVAPGKSADFRVDCPVANPRRWDIDQPNLYRAVVRARTGDRTLDDETIPFGIREFRFDAATGFWLNGRNVKIKGVCLHQDGGGVGVAVPLDMWERRLKRLKEIGVNAIRTAHNPPAPEFLNLCDRMGVLVMDELFDCWTVGKNPYDYHLFFREWARRDVRDTVRRDRNHPSIILYSAGNEIRDTPNAPLAHEILTSLVAAFHENDPTRPVTQALFRPNASHDYDNGLADLLDVVGQNYRENELLAAHAQKPTRKILGTENGHDRRTWLALRDNPACAGQFLWAGIDYLGESHGWPTVGSGSGLLDRTGEPRPLAYQRQSWWSDRPMVYVTRRVAPTAPTPTDPGYEPAAPPSRYRQALFPDWTPRDPGPHTEDVEVYSNCAQVELVLNGKSLGVKPKPADDSPRTWQVPFEPGTLRAVGMNGGKAVADQELRTAGKPAKLVLTADTKTVKSTWDGVCFVEARIVDADGVTVPEARDLIQFRVIGPGVVAGTDSADNASHESFQASERHAFQGRCICFLKAGPAPEPGDNRIMVTASAPGLAGASVTVLRATP